MAELSELLNPIDEGALSRAFHGASPTRFFAIEGFLRPDFLAEVMAAYPSYERAVVEGEQFRAVNEKRKVQVTKSSRFPEPVKRLSDALSSREFLDTVVRITGLEGLVADPDLSGGGMHVMASGGRLDVHVDFNILRPHELYRRLNILVFLNERWEERWGGHFELWDADVERCLERLAPLGNRCVVFNTTETSYHGVCPVRTPAGITRNSFAAYYYTPTPPEGTDGSFHSTVFRARPDEWVRGRIMAPVEKLARSIRPGLRRIKRSILGGGS